MVYIKSAPNVSPCPNRLGREKTFRLRRCQSARLRSSRCSGSQCGRRPRLYSLVQSFHVHSNAQRIQPVSEAVPDPTAHRAFPEERGVWVQPRVQAKPSSATGCHHVPSMAQPAAACRGRAGVPCPKFSILVPPAPPQRPQPSRSTAHARLRGCAASQAAKNISGRNWLYFY